MKPVTLHLAGDSTMSDYGPGEAPRAGWGQMLQEFVQPHVTVRNKAMSGRSSKSFIDEGRLDDLLGEVQAGDYVLIQFGHNDAKPDEERRTEPFGSYQSYLERYLTAAAGKEAQAVLITSVERRKFGPDGLLEPTHGDYPAAMEELARERGIPLLDLRVLTGRLYERMGPEESKQLFMWLEPGEHPNYPEGVRDDTHFSEQGARMVAALAAEGLYRLDLPCRDPESLKSSTV
ncbi:rhamnogalacturonan acetylesterase [Paenibacillus sambharensis]|uniref:Rhamnogalacturonan acetylesterase n=1 Tax=Paenibacillus sambharensis TaxID=1803190 RepID=A0A2W1LQT2_9BACL|nr:rhamnogalacturonan acetylesterase [Paenibacillus sambharensis]PZD94201.1 rhamnogalacturonan acetylesterase [Paenibacillus sambharensis]